MSRPVQVAEAIKSWVVEHRLRAGDRLPAEAEMIERFGMAKGTIRESGGPELADRLEAEGYVGIVGADAVAEEPAGPARPERPDIGRNVFADDPRSADPFL